jgi:UDP-N-acetylglucosamine--N-acetylmuramyl-(pentapeptide) pyrophosphoryl-undecaprenol N-acetylglucosamine transferase
LTPLLQAKTVQTGNPVRSAIFLASRAAGQRITKFSCRRPVLMIVGGSQGALALNEAVDRRFEELLEVADVIHLTGIGKGIAKTHARYFARPYVLEDLPHLYALADLVITRAGAGTLSELAALRKAAIVIPLTGVAHDHQMKNAVTLVETGAIELLPQENIDLLLQSVTGLLADTDKRRALGEHLAEAFPSDAAGRIARILLDSLEGQKIQS